MGDLISRIKKARTAPEKHRIGKYTFEPEVMEHRTKVIGLCVTQDLNIMNIYFKKPKSKVITFREVATTLMDKTTRGTL